MTQIFNAQQTRSTGPKHGLKLPTTKFAAGLVALSLAVSGFTAAPAHADDKDVALAVGGLLTLFVIGKAIDEAKDKKTSSQVTARVTRPDTPRKRRSTPVVRDGHFKIPSTCVVPARSRHNRTETVALESCVMKSRKSAQSLPSACETRVRTKRGRAHAYELGCLTNFGYRVSRS